MLFAKYYEYDQNPVSVLDHLQFDPMAPNHLTQVFPPGQAAIENFFPVPAGSATLLCARGLLTTTPPVHGGHLFLPALCNAGSPAVHP